MGNSSSTPKISAQDRAILDMKNQRDKLHQYQKRITIITNREKEIAKECLRNGDKRRALLALRKKKYQESLLAKTDQQLAQLETLTSDVEFALVQKDVVFGLQQGTNVLKEIHKEMGGLERVELILGENEEAQAYQNASRTMSAIEINEMLGTRMTNQEEDEVEDELEALAAEANKQRLPSTAEAGVIAPMPNAPTDAPKESSKERAARRAREREMDNGSEPILA
ncbi:charged multivesicular body protein-like protein 6 [Aureobasidium subglaciale]|nr:charged multivesicular body protein-like protein 6 [Aureobasidium subglaciale]KAI5224975.1 charged multivesicular body protein-like protein 6 [Aureobasidium subglaciale]KAI5225353.1 charged multivesicular body protein-like protein 6 [Aureobasidium subglaciale]KAI5261151.1 charged multivesicular body protein-like protein 6 [Aureobasidium subglaciale]